MADKKKIEKVYLFTGEIDIRREIETTKIIDALINPDFRLFDLEELSGSSASASDILSAVSTIPFASERKVVIVDRIEQLDADDQLKLVATIPHLSDQSCLIMMCAGSVKASKASKSSDTQQSKQAPSLQEDDGSDEDETETENTDGKKKRGLTTQLTNAVKKNGAVVNYIRMKADTLAPLIQQLVMKHGKDIKSPALTMLTSCLITNPSMADKEVEKLAAYIGDRKVINQEDVEAVIEKPDEDRIFPLIDAIASAQANRSVEFLNETFAASIKPDQDVLKTVALLARHFRILYQAKFLQDEARSLGIPSDDINSYMLKDQNPLKLSSDWQKNKINTQAKAFSKKELQWCMKRILECELSAKGIGKTGGTPRLNLEMLIFKLSQRKMGRR
ncbi:MAG: DNA polymerase III subunit delta [Armatimonadota bacterium]